LIQSQAIPSLTDCQKLARRGFAVVTRVCGTLPPPATYVADANAGKIHSQRGHLAIPFSPANA
jgi:hypothetical protein